MSCLESKEKAQACQQGCVTNHESETDLGSLIAKDKYHLLIYFINPWRHCGQPYNANHSLQKCTEKHGEELKPLTPPFLLKTVWSFDFKRMQYAVGFYQETGYRNDKADAKNWFLQPAHPIPWLTEEEQGTGKATHQREEQKVGELPVCCFDNGRVAEFYENT